MNATVTVAYASSLPDHLESCGIEPASVLVEEDLRGLRETDGRELIPLEHWLRMLDQAVDRLGRPDLPLCVGASMGTKHLGMLGYVGMSCTSMHEALRQLARYSHLVGNISNAVLVESGDDAELVWEWNHAALPPSSMAQVQMAARWSTGRRFTGKAELRADACFEFPEPQNLAEYHRIFGGECRFAQAQTKLVFPKHYLELPFTTAEPGLSQLISRQAQQVLTKLEPQTGFLEDLKRIISDGLLTNRTTLADVAQRLDTSVRSLQRRLAELDLRFQKVLDEVRLEQAERLLIDSRNTLAEIAFMLGYTEQSTFHNAFKRWTGTTPQGWRGQRTR